MGSEFGFRSREGAFDGPQRQAGDVCDLAVRQLFDRRQQDDVSFRVVQAGQSTLQDSDFCPNFVRRVRFFDLHRGVDRPPAVEERAIGDPEEPRAERAEARELADRGECLDEGFLGEVVGPESVSAGQVGQVTPQGRLVVFHQPPEGLSVAGSFDAPYEPQFAEGVVSTVVIGFLHDAARTGGTNRLRRSRPRP